MSNVALGLTLVVACALIEGGAQLSFKLSRLRASQRALWTAIGIGAYLLEITLYTLALREIDVTIAFAMGSLSFVSVAILSRLVLNEKIDASRAVGLLLILCGVTLMGAQA